MHISNSKLQIAYFHTERTSEGGNRNHSVSLPIILIKIKAEQMLPYLYKPAAGLYFMIFAFGFLFP